METERAPPYSRPIAHPFEHGEEAFRDRIIALKQALVIGGLSLAVMLPARRCRR